MFQVGDKVRGRETQTKDYMIMNSYLELGIVEALKEEKGKKLMYVKIKKHHWTEYQNSGFWVYDDENDFELIERSDD